METNTFVTQTDSQYVLTQSNKAGIKVFLLFSLIACLGFLVAWQTFVFFELIVILAVFASFLQQRKKNFDWSLQFEEDELTITNLKTGQSFYVTDIPASDFIITQTKEEIPLNYCSFAVKHTVFVMGGVQNCRELKAYIREHYRERG